MKFVSWNVNGLRAIVGKGFEDTFKQFDADFVCLRKLSCRKDNSTCISTVTMPITVTLSAKVIQGTAIFTRHKPLSVRTNMGVDRHDHEGRIVALEYDNFYIVTVYTPNSQSELARL